MFKLKRLSAGYYEVSINGQTIEIWKDTLNLWYISNNPYAYFETLKAVKNYLKNIATLEE